jgi:hypothetical protein
MAQRTALPSYQTRTNRPHTATLCQLINTFILDFSSATVVVRRGWLDLQGTFAILRLTLCCYITSETAP